MNIKKLALSIVLCAAAVAAAAQNVSDLIVSEAVAINVEGIVDDFGRHTPWVELTNTSQGTVKFAGCFLTDDPAEPRKYMIPKGDASTTLGPRQAVIFWCSGFADEGTYYTNFTIGPGSTVYLVSNDGRTVIDSIAIPEDLPSDLAVIKVAKDNKGLKFNTEEEPALPSPGTLNKAGNPESGAQRMAHNDPHGWILTVTSVSVVFAALIILWWLFSAIGKGFKKTQKAPAKKDPDEATAAAIALALDMEADGDTYAAIAMALHLYMNETVHDSESYTITFTPAQVKHFNFRKLPR